jgi:hypothetical protein
MEGRELNILREHNGQDRVTCDYYYVTHPSPGVTHLQRRGEEVYITHDPNINTPRVLVIDDVDFKVYCARTKAQVQILVEELQKQWPKPEEPEPERAPAEEPERLEGDLQKLCDDFKTLGIDLFAFDAENVDLLR